MKKLRTLVHEIRKLWYSRNVVNGEPRGEPMYDAATIAKYFFTIDKDGLFNEENRINKNSRVFIIGNARLNKYLHLAQNIYVAKNKQLLFPNTIYAYDNGGVVREVQNNYYLLKKNKSMVDLDEETSMFIRRIYYVLKNAPLDKLIELSHQDPAWKEKHNGYSLKEQEMNPLDYLDDYQNRYKDIIKLMEGLDV